MWYADAGGQFEAVTYSNDGLTWNSPIQTTGILAGGYHAKLVYLGSTYKIWYWDSTNSIYSINALRTADSTNGVDFVNDQALTQDATMP
jgi:hypothetical protein